MWICPGVVQIAYTMCSVCVEKERKFSIKLICTYKTVNEYNCSVLSKHQLSLLTRAVSTCKASLFPDDGLLACLVDMLSAVTKIEKLGVWHTVSGNASSEKVYYTKIYSWYTYFTNIQYTNLDTRQLTETHPYIHTYIHVHIITKICRLSLAFYFVCCHFLARILSSARPNWCFTWLDVTPTKSSMSCTQDFDNHHSRLWQPPLNMRKVGDLIKQNNWVIIYQSFSKNCYTTYHLST